LSTLNGLLIGIMIVFVLDYILRNARSRMMQRAALEIDVKVGQALYDKIMALPMSELGSRPSAYWQALFRDAETVRNTLSGPTAIVGPNGCGKSTLVKIMQGLYQATESRVLLDGANIKQFTRAEMAGWMGYVPQ
tara:strand:+ start:4354 stop:4758 length:405 start_codon:yes stop_codon:yes gene_type:complete